MSLASKILLGLALGILVGLFFGERVGFLEGLGNAFVKLLQMTVLPYVTVSLVAGLGSLSLEKARMLATRLGVLLLVMWGISLAIVLCLPLVFPDWQAGSFFSTTLVEPRPELDLISLYIPSNPFHSLANNVVPAVVLFSIAVGVALIGIERKQPLLETLGVLSDSLGNIAGFVVRLAPYGVFAIAASAAGTLGVSELGRVQVYLLCYMAGALLLTLWVLPALLTTLTPLRYGDVFGVARDALVTAFATGSVFVVLPILSEKSKQMLAERDLGGDEADSEVDVLVPTAYSFPDAGDLLALLFVFFAAWLSGSPVPLTEVPVLAFSALVSFFGSVLVAIPFLLDMAQVPEDTFQLFVMTGVLNARFSTLLGAMNVLTVALLGACALGGSLRLGPFRILRYLAITLLLAIGVIGGGRMFFSLVLEDPYDGGEILAEMRMLREPTAASVFTEPAPPREPRAGRTTLEVIRETGSLRFGYLPDRLPFSFMNQDSELVGFDIELAHRLATNLGVRLELVPIDQERIAQHLANNDCDLITSLAVSPERAQRLEFTIPVMEGTIGFVVKDHRRAEFESLKNLRGRSDLRIGIPTFDRYWVEHIRRYISDVNLIPTDSLQFFEGSGQELDALVHVAEMASVWTLLYPQYKVVVPESEQRKLPIAFPVAHGDLEMVNFMNSWIRLKRLDGTLQQLYDHWILGRTAEQRRPRWSIARDVLGWID